ncbi:MAG TPA: nuclease-related domain-containing protein [Nocardioides sp.]|nr:nuclease-related domain-containing protein [Nocardioides sp.]
MAGDSADAIARRQRSRIARLERSANLWERGAAGERATAKALTSLPSDSWVVLHDVRWPGRPFANLDHVAIGPSGVFVIDSKNWSGSVRLDGPVLRQDGRTRARELVSAREAAAAVARLLAVLPAAQVSSVLCFVGKDLTGWAGPVLVCNTSNIAHVLTSRRTVMTPELVRAVANELRARLQNDPAPRPAPMPSPRPRKARTASGRVSVAATLVGAFLIGTFAYTPRVATGIADFFVQTIASESETAPADRPAKRKKGDGGQTQREARSDRQGQR